MLVNIHDVYQLVPAAKRIRFFKLIGHLHDGVRNYQNAFRCSLCYADLCHARAILHKRKNTEYNSLPQSILVLVVK